MNEEKRVFKFRVWDRDEEEWIDERDMGYIISECSECDNCLNAIFNSSHNTVIQQFTGLKDRDGKEIYEGDITEIENDSGGINRFIVKYGIVRRKLCNGFLGNEIEVDIPSFYFDLIDGNFKAFPIVKNYLNKHDLHIMKIVGNIFENPELLNF